MSANTNTGLYKPWVDVGSIAINSFQDFLNNVTDQGTHYLLRPNFEYALYQDIVVDKAIKTFSKNSFFSNPNRRVLTYTQNDTLFIESDPVGTIVSASDNGAGGTTINLGTIRGSGGFFVVIDAPLYSGA